MTPLSDLRTSRRWLLGLWASAWMWGWSAHADPGDRTFEWSITQGLLPATERLVRVTQGDTVRLRMTSDAPGEVHLHAYRLQVAVDVHQTAELTFKAHASGRYRIEWHPKAVSAPTGGHHHGPPLAQLEVRPK